VGEQSGGDAADWSDSPPPVAVGPAVPRGPRRRFTSCDRAGLNDKGTLARPGTVWNGSGTPYGSGAACCHSPDWRTPNVTCTEQATNRPGHRLGRGRAEHRRVNVAGVLSARPGGPGGQGGTFNTPIALSNGAIGNTAIALSNGAIGNTAIALSNGAIGNTAIALSNGANVPCGDTGTMMFAASPASSTAHMATVKIAVAWCQV